MSLRHQVLLELERSLPGLRERYHVRRLRLYGSTARGDDAVDSDVDILVEFMETPSLFDMARLQDELQSLLGRRVDITTPGGLHPRILATAEQEGIEVEG